MAEKKKSRKKPAKTAQEASTRTAKEEVLARLSEQQNRSTKLQSVILFALAILFLALAFVHGSQGWLVMHRFIRGVFGFSVLLVPVVLFICAYNTEKQSEIPFGKRLALYLGLVVLVSSLIQIIFVGDIEKDSFFKAVQYLFRTGQTDTFRCGGVISVILAYPLLHILGATGARIILIVAFFVCLMWILGWSMQQLWYYITIPFRKLKDFWGTEADFSTIKNYRKDNEEKPKKIRHKKEEQEDAQGEEKESFFDRIRNKVEGALFVEEEEDEYEPAPTIADEEMDYSREPALDLDLDEEPGGEDFSEEDAARLDDIYKNIQQAIGNENPIVTEEEILTNPPQNLQQELPQVVIPEQEEAVPFEPEATMSEYQFPTIDFLEKGISKANDPEAEAELTENANVLLETLKNFGVEVTITGIYRGPTVTRYEIQPAAGIKVSKITSLADDIALSLAAQGVRIEAPVPGKPAIGIEVPNSHKDTVSLREILESGPFHNSKSKLTFAIGRDIAGTAVVGDIAKLPHMIIAGATGSGKSVCTNSIIMSILYNAAPTDVKLILIDPKIVEFTVYNGIPHLLIPVVTDPKKAAGALNWAVQEMQRRYQIFADNSVRDLGDYNSLADSEENELERMPQIVIIIDELADLMMTTGKDVEDAICRLAQKARAAGMHLIIATQRPTKDIITGLIKANIPSRIALSVMSNVDSRIILDTGGAEKLLGHGDMLYLPNGKIKPVRIQGCFTSTKEIEKAVTFIKETCPVEADHSEIQKQMDALVPAEKGKSESTPSGTTTEENATLPIETAGDSDAEVLERAIEVVVEAGQASTSSLQRRLKLGYARAARIMDELEQIGIIGPYEGAKPRKVLMSKEQYNERKMRRLP